MRWHRTLCLDSLLQVRQWQCGSTVVAEQCRPSAVLKPHAGVAGFRPRTRHSKGPVECHEPRQCADDGTIGSHSAEFTHRVRHQRSATNRRRHSILCRDSIPRWHAITGRAAGNALIPTTARISLRSAISGTRWSRVWTPRSSQPGWTAVGDPTGIRADPWRNGTPIRYARGPTSG